MSELLNEQVVEDQNEQMIESQSLTKSELSEFNSSNLEALQNPEIHNRFSDTFCPIGAQDKQNDNNENSSDSVVVLYIKVPVAVETPAFLPAVVVVPIPTDFVAVNIPVTIAPELFACIFTFPSVCLILVASIPI